MSLFIDQILRVPEFFKYNIKTTSLKFFIGTHFSILFIQFTDTVIPMCNQYAANNKSYGYVSDCYAVSSYMSYKFKCL